MTEHPTKPLITFLLISYNQENFIIEAVRGALAQTYSPMEIVISDDCSSDRTFELIEEVVNDYPGPHRIKLNRNERNLGIGGNVNRAMAMAEGQWIVAAAGDDISYPERVERLHKNLNGCTEPTYLIYSDYEIIDEASNPIGVYKNTFKGNFGTLEEMCNNGLGGITGCSAAWHRAVFETFGPLDEGVIFEDRVIAFRAKLMGHVAHIDQPLLGYRRHDSNTVNLFDSGLLVDHKRAVSYYLSAFQNALKDCKTWRFEGRMESRDYIKLTKLIKNKINKLEAYSKIHSGEFFGIAQGLCQLAVSRGNVFKAIVLAARLLMPGKVKITK